ncbi:DUF3363 domain-containing protein, partial [Salmonella enterica]|nr:DUF3363 domain-containing protein [Salmonella enterica]EGB9844738.1 DUF3363 domain-containing protein [Salmonella enterica]
MISLSPPTICNSAPWRPIIDRQLGREVMGIVQGGSVSWQLGRQRGLER